MRRHANNRNISDYLFDRFPYPYTISDAEKFISSHQNQSPLTTFAIIIDQNAVGGISFTQEADVHRKAAILGYWLGEAYWGEGIMTEAVRLVTAYAFGNFDIIRIQATVNGNNPASMRVLEKAGFVKEGVLKNAIFKNGEILDEHLYALLA